MPSMTANGARTKRLTRTCVRLTESIVGIYHSGHCDFDGVNVTDVTFTSGSRSQYSLRKEMQLGGSHDHPITLHIRSGAAFGNDFGLAGVPRSKRHEPHRQPKLRSRCRKSHLQCILGDEEDRQVLARLYARQRREIAWR